MRLTTTLAAAAAISVAGATANAGGLAPEVMEAPVVVVEPMMEKGGSIPAGYIVLGLVAALVAASASF
jgi:hypothetical protein